MKISHAKAIELIQDHGWADGWVYTAWYPKTGIINADSSFYGMLGYCREYSRAAVMAWLGY